MDRTSRELKKLAASDGWTFDASRHKMFHLRGPGGMFVSTSRTPSCREHMLHHAEKDIIRALKRAGLPVPIKK